EPGNGLAAMHGNRRPELSHGNQGRRRPAEDRDQEVFAATQAAHAAQGEAEIKATYASSSIGRAAVSKAAGWGFDSLLACLSPGERTVSVDGVGGHAREAEVIRGRPAGRVWCAMASVMKSNDEN